MTAIRVATDGDAAQLIDLFATLDTETAYMKFEPGERKTSIHQQIEIIRDIALSTSRILFLAEDKSNIGQTVVGFLGASGGEGNRRRHNLHLTMGVLQSHWGRGVGSHLLRNVTTWATDQQFHRMELSVLESNLRAIALYLKMGFASEGVRRDSMHINGKYVSELSMSRLI